MTSQYFPDGVASELENPQPIDWHTNFVLLLDDDIRLSSMIARYILLSCREYARSCAIFHIGQGAQPKLTYQHIGPEADRRRVSNQSDGLDFAVFVATSPRHAIAWVEEVHPTELTLVADVKLRGDIDLSLMHLLEVLSKMEIPTYSIFVSDAPQNQNLVKPMLDGRKANFVTKGSPDWMDLPHRLVQNVGRTGFYPIRKSDYALLPRTVTNPLATPTSARS